MSASPEDATQEPLACVNCRSRKLKCDRQKPACTRCAKGSGECVYPESRRKPAFKRRNVRELEERLAQVEGLLKSVGKQRAGQAARSDDPWTEESSPGSHGGEPSRPDRSRGSPQEGPMPWAPLSPTETPRSGDGSQPGELLDLGMFESPPPFEMIEDLHRIFFETQPHFMSIIHPSNYLRSFHSPPHMRPPMCLQYAIWTMAANGHPKYGRYHDALYRRARQYLEADELKGHGEHFITTAHSQAWAIVAMDEARCLLFTRASMSSAKSIRLAAMMGLQRLDGPPVESRHPVAPMIAQHQTWAELEERRRLFWAGYCLDSYAGISTGWPTLIDVDQVTTHLPASEEAFISGVEEPAPTLQGVFQGASYSTFGGNVVSCYIFNQMVRHAQRPMPGDRPEDAEFGRFWKRHRELDNMLSSAFMFLPERYRLARNMRDPVALQANLNLHAAVICLHNAASETADKHKLPGIKQTSRTRALTAAHEIADIVRASSYMSSGYRGPLMALSLYCAASVYITQAKDDPEHFDSANLELLAKCMESIGRQHVMTRAYLTQLLHDIEQSGISMTANIIPSYDLPKKPLDHGIPVLARGATSRHTDLQSPMPGRLPLGARGWAYFPSSSAPSIPCATMLGPYPTASDNDAPASKRMRTSAEPNPDAPPASTGTRINPPGRGGPSVRLDGSAAAAAPLFGYPAGGPGWPYAAKYTTTTLPHRTGSPANTVPNLGGFAMAGPSAAAFPQMPSSTPSSVGAGFAGSTRNTNTNTNTNTDLGSAIPELGGVFENLDDWGVADPESLYAMLMDVSSDEFGTSQTSLGHPWASTSTSTNNGAGGSSSGATGPWDTGGRTRSGQQ